MHLLEKSLLLASSAIEEDVVIESSEHSTNYHNGIDRYYKELLGAITQILSHDYLNQNLIKDEEARK